MFTKFFILTFLLIAAVASVCQSNEARSPFSFAEIRKNPGAPLGPPQFIRASDGIELAFYAKIPASKPSAALILLHGGGAHSGAGYQHIAEGLRNKYDIAVYLMDLRGHGKSGGPRGDSPSVGQVWEDLKLLVNAVREKNPGIPLYLAGHSSGAGLLLNYLTWEQRAPVDGYFFISPQFGYKSETARHENQNPFVTVRYWVFVLSAISGGRFFGHTPAVYFNYSEEVFASQPLLLKSITRNMSVALTPSAPQEQFRKIDRPFGLFIGDGDELFLPEKVMKYFGYAPKEIQKISAAGVIKNANHLSILLKIDDAIGKMTLAGCGT